MKEINRRDSVKSSRRQSQRGVLKIAVIYAVAGMLWVLFSDKLVEMLFPSVATVTRVAIIKGWLFVSVTAVLIYYTSERLHEESGTISRGTAG